MIPRTRLVPIHNMAYDLGQHRPADRETPEAAALLLLHLGYRAGDVQSGVDAALRIAREAASDRPGARALGVIRDVTAALAITACVWALPA